MYLEAEEILQIHVQCEAAIGIGDDGSGNLNVIPIVGGTFEGKIKGKVIPLGADWNSFRSNGLNDLYAKYLLQTEDGQYIAIVNEGCVRWEDNKMIKTVPRFQVSSSSQYAWLNRGVYVGKVEFGDREGLIEITIYELK